jgi:hypothetical protein
MLSTKSLLKISSLFLLATFFTVDTTLAAKYPNVCSYLIRTASEQDKSRGENVRQIQIALIGDRYADFGIPSGFYGSKTSEAVKFFQAIHGIYPVGSTGPRTLAAMRMAWCSDKDEEAKVETQPVSSANTKNISITLEPKTENNVRKLFWKAVNADACSLNNSKVATSSSKDLGTIMATTSFTLACNNSNASTSKSVSVFPLAKTSVTTADNVDDESATEDDSSSQDDSSSNDSQDYSDDSSDDTSDAGFEDNSEDYSEDFSDDSNDDTPASTSTTNTSTTNTSTASSTTSRTSTATTSATRTTSTASTSASSTTSSTATVKTPTISAFTFKSVEVNNQNKTRLTWTSKDAVNCTLDGGALNNEKVPKNGTLETPAESKSTTYTIACLSSGKKGSKTVTVPGTVTHSISLTANPTYLTRSLKTTLTWKTTGLSGCTIDNGVGAVPADGSKSVSLTKSLTYTLTCKNSAKKEIKDTVKVTVISTVTNDR